MTDAIKLLPIVKEDAGDHLPPIAYGVWIPGVGWLKHGSRAFADVHREVAAAAARLYGGPAFVVETDAPEVAMLELEGKFLEQERKRERERQDRRVLNRIRKALRAWNPK